MKSHYWWSVTYLYEHSNNSYRFYDEGMARCVKPRIMFLDWLINVLTAYKNEYVNI